MNALQPELSEWLKTTGMSQANASVAPDWKDAADAVIRALAASGEAFTSEAVTAQVGQPTGPNGESKPNAVGARISANAKRGLIERVGFVKATRVNQHATMISLWKGRKC